MVSKIQTCTKINRKNVSGFGNSKKPTLKKAKLISGRGLDECFIYSIKEVSNILRMHERTVRRMIKFGELNASMTACGYRVEGSTIKQFLLERRVYKDKTEITTFK
jgi:excisionase family DNA binding protein